MHNRRSPFFSSASFLTVLVLSFLLVGCASSAKPAAPPATSGPTTAGDWAMYGHDAQRSGYDPGESLVNTSNVDRLEQAWQVNIGLNSAGRPAFSAPIVAGGTVYVASSVTSGNNFYALDAVTGAPRWATNIGADPNECFKVTLGSTPAISSDGQVIVIGGGDGAYYGLSTPDGTQLWRDPVNEGPSAFAWTSPIIANGKAYVGIASDCDDPSVRGDIYTIDVSTGSRVTNRYIVPEGSAGGGIWNSAALSADGTKLFITTGEDFAGYDGPNTRAIMELDANNLQIVGSNRQGVPNTDGDWATTPLVFEDSQGRPMVGAGHKDGVFYAYYQGSLQSGPVWSAKPGPNVGLLPAFDAGAGAGGAVFINGQHKVYALNATDGTVLWTSDQVDETRGNIAIANGLIYLNAAGSLVVLDEATGKTLRTITPDNNGSAYSGPVIANGTVYWVSGAFINAWHLADSAGNPTEIIPPSPGGSSHEGPFFPCGLRSACPGYGSRYLSSSIRLFMLDPAAMLGG